MGRSRPGREPRKPARLLEGPADGTLCQKRGQGHELCCTGVLHLGVNSHAQLPPHTHTHTSHSLPGDRSLRGASDGLDPCIPALPLRFEHPHPQKALLRVIWAVCLLSPSAGSSECCLLGACPRYQRVQSASKIQVLAGLSHSGSHCVFGLGLWVVDGPVHPCEGPTCGWPLGGLADPYAACWPKGLLYLLMQCQGQR